MATSESMAEKIAALGEFKHSLAGPVLRRALPR
jgi:hypothetical protein